MEKDIEPSKNKFDIDNFENTLQPVLDPIELWLIAGTLRDTGITSPTQIIRLVRESYEQGYFQKPPQTILAQASSCSTPLVSKVWNDTGYKNVEKKETALLSPDEERKLLTKVLSITDNTGFITAQEIRDLAGKMKNTTVGHSWHIGFVNRNAEFIQPVQTDKREEKRMQLKEEYIWSYYYLLLDILKGILVELIINADEMGYSQY
ncbi:MAG: hypothetical protein EZS28_016876 [Streblomastix strix]|uniref:HTH CENPB-type domain-containing protein n=1 Tax=Streblomastix strix TaxID=222440 RepID=A0A5J4VZC5_9EUKA|nr:MAG: hypothetical protein EZS28_016876 [Streblomastix strix]